MFKIMLKINLITAIIITTLLSSCGFHTPYKNSSINAFITSDKNNLFADELKKRFNQEAPQTLTIKIDSEGQNKQTSSYSSDGKTSGYTLSLNIPVKVISSDNKLLLSQDLTASTHLSKITSSTQADRLQTEESYTQLRNTIIKKLLRRLSKLNEN